VDSDAGPLATDASQPDALEIDAPTCDPAIAHDVGAPDSFMTGTAVFFPTYNIFVLRDGGGLYAMSGLCTHQGGYLQQVNDFLHCFLHNANFDLDGAVLSGPAPRALDHYALCLLATGNVGLDPNTTVAPATRLVA
jgi:cytochrome b6-f complex iron-sulfur subunit